MDKKFFIIIFSFVFLNASSIKVMPPKSEFDTIHNYYFELLKKVLKVTESKYGKTNIVFSEKMEQGRALVYLKNGKSLDLHWAGTSKKREEELKAIKIPLLKGLLGFRKLIIHKDNLEKFNKINTLDDLRKYKACQGTHWPDTKILENAKIKVVKNTNYEAMFFQIKSKRCDFFPRAIFEASPEVESRKDILPQLMVYKDLALVYDFPMYFFVSKENIDLYERIKEGLTILFQTKEFDKFMMNHEVTKHIFPIEEKLKVKSFKLDNPYANKNKITNEIFWFTK